MCKIKDGSIDIPSSTAMKSYCCWYPSRYKIHLSNLLPFLFTQWQNMIPYSLPFSISRPFSISKQSMSKSHYKAPGGLSVKNVKTQWLTSGEWGYPLNSCPELTLGQLSRRWKSRLRQIAITINYTTPNLVISHSSDAHITVRKILRY